MATESKTLQEWYDFYKDQVTAIGDDLKDFSDGSMNDIIAGAFSASMNELSELLLAEFRKTFIDTATGTEDQGGEGTADDLQTLAVDHFGDNFSRPQAEPSTGVIKFSRPNTDAGNVTIPIGTAVKTEADSGGNEIRFVTTEEVTMIGLEIEANIEADTGGSNTNVLANKIVILESTLTDNSITCNNEAAMAGGTDEQTDSDYRETIKNLIQSLAGATKQAILGVVSALASVEYVSLSTTEKIVIEWDIGSSMPLGEYFRIPYPVVYVADASGNSSPALLAEVEAAIEPIKACGVLITVKGAIPIVLNWTGSVTLDSGGPNFASLQNDLTPIINTMNDYINNEIEIGEGFSRISANQYILSIWGPAGTGDITQFSTVSPSADVVVDSNEKIVVGTNGIN
jgi:hypothetical protein